MSRPTKQHLPREGPYYLTLVQSTRCEGLLCGNYGEVNLFITIMLKWNLLHLGKKRSQFNIELEPINGSQL